MGSPRHDGGGWDLIEGQGSLFHPSFAGVSLGLLHGSQADALVLCHALPRPHMGGLPHYPVPGLKICLETNLQLARLTQPEVKAIGVALNTSKLTTAAAADACKAAEDALGLPCFGPCHPGSRSHRGQPPRMLRKLSIQHQSWPLATPFRISRGVKTIADVVVVEIEGRQRTRAWRRRPLPPIRRECRVSVGTTTTRHLRAGWWHNASAMQSRLPPGAARNAADCALWDLEASATRRSVAELLDAGPVPPLTTALTVGIDTPERMREAAERLKDAPLIKVKLDAAAPEAQLCAVRAGAPAARLIADPNESWNIEILKSMQAVMLETAVEVHPAAPACRRRLRP